MTIIFATLSLVLGALIGSFLSVVIFRIRENKKGIFFSRSICPHCETKLKKRHLIPVISWIFLKGKCAFCRKNISPRYLFLELTTALLFLLTFLNFNFLIPIFSSIDASLITYSIDYLLLEKFIIYIVLFSLLIAILFYDLLYQEIPDRLSLPAIAVAIVSSIILGTPEIFDMLIASATFFAFFGIQILISKGEWVGGGDLRMAILIGTLLGLKFGLMALILAYFIGAVISIGLIIAGKAGGKTKIPFAPFLISGILLAIFLGENIYTFYQTFILY
jgi:leader peptidase (prepilin peptidase) / N-methyltransferase